jgi:hypothetical protein
MVFHYASTPSTQIFPYAKQTNASPDFQNDHGFCRQLHSQHIITQRYIIKDSGLYCFRFIEGVVRSYIIGGEHTAGDVCRSGPRKLAGNIFPDLSFDADTSITGTFSLLY